jgi:hypothetical protein
VTRRCCLIGFAGAFRRSELCQLALSDIEWMEEGVLVYLNRSKTDQKGAGRRELQFQWAKRSGVLSMRFESGLSVLQFRRDRSFGQSGVVATFVKMAFREALCRSSLRTAQQQLGTIQAIFRAIVCGQDLRQARR